MPCFKGIKAKEVHVLWKQVSGISCWNKPHVLWAWPAPNYRTGHGKIFAHWFGMLKAKSVHLGRAGMSFVNMKAEMNVLTTRPLTITLQRKLVAKISSWKVTNEILILRRKGLTTTKTGNYYKLVNNGSYCMEASLFSEQALARV